MSTPEDLRPVLVSVDDPQEEALAVRVLEEEDRAAVRRSPGAVSGRAGADAVARMRTAGLVVVFTGAPRAPVSPLPGGGAELPLEEVHDFALKLHRFLYESGAALPHPEVARLIESRTLRGRLRAGTRVAREIVRAAADLPRWIGTAAGALRGIGLPGLTLETGTTGGLSLPEPSSGPEPPAAAPAPPSAAGDVYEVRLHGRMDDEVRDAFAALGAEPLSHRPPDVYRFYLDAAALEAVRALFFVQSVEPYGPEATVEDGVVHLLDEGDTATARTFDVVLHRASDLPRVRSIVEAEPGVEVLDAGGGALRFRAVPRAPFLSGLTQLAEVASLDVYQPPRLLCDVARVLMGVEGLAPPPGGTPWDGTGEGVAVFDSGLDASHPDLRPPRVARRKWGRGSEDDASGHGTHVAGIVAGDGSASGGRLRGVAPGARLVSVGITHGASARPELDLPVDVGELLGVAKEHDAAIVNLSWGNATDDRLGLAGRLRHSTARYEQVAKSIDQFVYDNPNVLVVVAAGNEGTAPQGVPEFYRVCSPGTAKNVVTVGASLGQRPEFAARTWASRGGFGPPVADEPMAGDPDHVAALSSTGPTRDRVIKPDVLAPGTFILSARAREVAPGLVWEPFPALVDERGRQWYCFSGGTSMAAPAVAGAAAVVRQYLRRDGGPVPSAALLKAVLIASARRVPSRRPPPQQASVGFPDFDQGFGRVDLSNVLPHPKAPPGRRLLVADVPNGGPGALVSGARPGSGRRETGVYRITVSEGAVAPLTVVLTWTDRAEAGGAQSRLQLSVRRPDGVQEEENAGHVYGRLDPTGVQEPDWRNTVKVVRVDPPLPGPYRIVVFADNTPSLPQGYALALCGEVEEDALA